MKIPCFCQKSKANPWVYSKQARYLTAEVNEESVTESCWVEIGGWLVCIKTDLPINTSSFDSIYGSGYFCEEAFSQMKIIK
jgi:hypothetical protein